MTKQTLAVAAALALALARPAHADVDAAGNLSTRVSLEVPSFYTIAPPMALVHHEQEAKAKVNGERLKEGAHLLATVTVSDPRAVLDAMTIGRDTGRWVPPVNDCNVHAMGISPFVDPDPIRRTRRVGPTP